MVDGMVYWRSFMELPHYLGVFPTINIISDIYIDISIYIH